MRTWNIPNQGKCYIYRIRNRSRVVELLLQLENKQQTMQNNVEIQHKSMYSIYISSLCIMIAFPLARFTTGVRGNLNAMNHIALSSAQHLMSNIML